VLRLFGDPEDEARARLRRWMEDDCRSRHGVEMVDATDTRGSDLALLVAAVCGRFGVPESSLRGRARSGSVSAVRAAVSYLGCDRLGFRCTQVARELGVSAQAVGKARLRGESLVGLDPSLIDLAKVSD
jgi:hypothetical protein